MDVKEKNALDFRERLHNCDRNGFPCSVNLNAVVEYIKESVSFFVIKGVFYVYSYGVYIPDYDGVEMWEAVKKCLYPQFINPYTIQKIVKLLVMDKSHYMRDDSKLNDYDEKWICFKNGMYNPITNEITEHKAEYNAVSMIPFSYVPGADHKGRGKNTDAFLSFAIPDADDREMLLEFMGLCLTHDIHQQVFLLLTGTGGTGKSTLINLLQYIVGRSNISNVPLEKIGERFSGSQLMGKLLNACSDLSIEALNDVSIIKRATGEDPINAEKKGKDGFDFMNYARMIFSTNELPIVKGEKTNGIYRRLLIVKMNNTPTKKDASLFDKLKSEADYFLFLIVEALRRLYSRGEILVSEGSRRATAEMWAASDTVQAFLLDRCEKGTEADRIEKKKLLEAYLKYCQEYERKPLTRNSFYRSYEDKEIYKEYGDIKTNGITLYRGIKFQELPWVSIENAKEEERITEMFKCSG